MLPQQLTSENPHFCQIIMVPSFPCPHRLSCLRHDSVPLYLLPGSHRSCTYSLRLFQYSLPPLKSELSLHVELWH